MANHRKPPQVKSDSRAAVEAARAKKQQRKERQARVHKMSDNLRARGMGG